MFEKEIGFKVFGDKISHLSHSFKIAGFPMFTIQSLKETVGFAHVDAHVTDVMVAWIGSVVMKTCQDMISTARTARVTTVATTSCTGRGSRQGFTRSDIIVHNS